MGVSWSEQQAETASFLAVVPPPETAERIQDLRGEVGVDTAVLPHITIKAEPGLGDVDVWRPVVRDAVSRRPSFDISLTVVGWFGLGIVYLAVSPEIVDLHWMVLSAVESVVDGERFEYDGDAYVPHLTLGAEFAGATRSQLDALANRAQEFNGASFTVDSVVEFHRASHGETYVPVNRFALSS